MTKLIKHSKENIRVKQDTTNYRATGDDLKGHLQGIDDALGNNSGGAGYEQNNFVRNIYINIDQYGFYEDYSSMDWVINQYLDTLPDEEKTISETDSKINFILYSSYGS